MRFSIGICSERRPLYFSLGPRINMLVFGIIQRVVEKKGSG